MRALLLCLLFAFSGCATEQEMRDVSDALWGVQRELATLRADSSPEDIERAAEKVDEAAVIVQTTAEKWRARFDSVADGVVQGISAAEAGGISGLASLLAVFGLNLWRNRTRKRDIETATHPTK